MNKLVAYLGIGLSIIFSLFNPANAQPFAQPFSMPLTVQGFALSNDKIIDLRWQDLTPAQQEALAPLAKEWNTLEPTRKRKWLVMAAKFWSLPAEKQQRLQQSMKEWAGLSPAQRRIARENYLRARKMSENNQKMSGKSITWQQYQQLSPAQKQKLAADANLLPKSIANTAPSIKKPPLRPYPKDLKRMMEQTVQAADQSPSKNVKLPIKNALTPAPAKLNSPIDNRSIKHSSSIVTDEQGPSS